VTRKKTRRKACVFDIETIADPEMAKLLPAVKASGNLRDPEKIKIDIKEKEKKRRNEMGLHPLQNMVCCMAIHDLETGKSQAITMAGDTGKAEKLVLEKAWEALSNYDFFVSFNGIEFDVRFLNLNSLKRRVRQCPDYQKDVGQTNFDADQMAPKCVGKPKYSDMTADEIKASWEVNAQRARNEGTNVHEYAECLWAGRKVPNRYPIAADYCLSRWIRPLKTSKIGDCHLLPPKRLSFLLSLDWPARSTCFGLIIGQRVRSL
jgi:hypothetical protein